MRNYRRLVCLVLLAPSAAPALPATSAGGDWLTPTGSVVRVQHCGASVCLAVVKLPPSATRSTDQQNPDAGLRNRPICGLVIGTGFHESDPAHLAGGRLYDPESGHTYRGTITAEGESLRLRGYVGISLFGRSEVWKRVPAVASCHS